MFCFIILVRPVYLNLNLIFLPLSTYLHLVVPLFLPLSLLFFSLLLVGDGHPTVNRESLQWVYKPLLLG